jgi:hypothetical protein
MNSPFVSKLYDRVLRSAEVVVAAGPVAELNREVSAKGTDTLFLDGLCHIRKSLCRSALHGVTRDGPLASKWQTEVLWPGLRRKRAAPIASIAACHACAEEPIRFTSTGSPWRVLTRWGRAHGAMPTPSHTDSYFISKTQESVLSKRSDMTKTDAKWAFLAQIAFAGTHTRHPSG